MDTVQLPNRHRDVSEVLRNILEALVPVLLTATIISLIVFRADVSDKFDATAHDIRVTACHAVGDSNEALDDFLDRQASTPEFKRFVADLRQAHEETLVECLRVAGP